MEFMKLCVRTIQYIVYACTEAINMSGMNYWWKSFKQQCVLHSLKIIQNKSGYSHLKLTAKIGTRTINNWAISLQVKLSANKNIVKHKEKTILAMHTHPQTDLFFMSQGRALHVDVNSCLEIPQCLERLRKATRLRSMWSVIRMLQQTAKYLRICILYLLII